jgi:hypothetical protein
LLGALLVKNQATAKIGADTCGGEQVFIGIPML